LDDKMVYKMNSNRTSSARHKGIKGALTCS
jgi:hypothetical protein